MCLPEVHATNTSSRPLAAVRLAAKLVSNQLFHGLLCRCWNERPACPHHTAPAMRHNPAKKEGTHLITALRANYCLQTVRLSRRRLVSTTSAWAASRSGPTRARKRAPPAERPSPASLRRTPGAIPVMHGCACCVSLGTSSLKSRTFRPGTCSVDHIVVAVALSPVMAAARLLVVQLPTLHLAHASHSLLPLSALHTRLRRPLSRRANPALMFAINPLPPAFSCYPLPFAGSTLP